MKANLRRCCFVLLMSFFYLGMNFSSFGVDYYIDYVNGNNSSGDGSQIKPWKTVSYAVKKTEANTTEDTYHVLPGKYSNDPTVSVFNREVFPIKIRPKTKIIGAGKGVTILDAGYIAETTARFIEGVADNDMTDILLEGITFQNNNITNQTDAPGVYLINTSGAIKNCEFINLKTNGQRGPVWIIGDNISKFTFSGNLVKTCSASASNAVAGGVIIEKTNLEFLANEIDGCSSPLHGNAALYNLKGIIKSNKILNGGSSGYGAGGITLSGCSAIEIAYNTFDGNGGMRIYGSHLYTYQTSTIRVHHNVFQNAKYQYDNYSSTGFYQGDSVEVDNNVYQSNFQNQASTLAGGIYSYSLTSLNIHDNVLSANQGSNTGAIDVRYSTGIIKKNIISNNRGTYYAGGIYLIDSVVDVVENEITENVCLYDSAQSAGALITYSNNKVTNIIGNLISSNTSYRGAAAIYVEAFKGNISENNIIANTCQDSSKFVVNLALSNDSGTKTKIANNIIAANSGNGVYLVGGSADTKFFINNTLVNQTQNQLTIASDSWNVYNNIFYGGRTSITETNVFTIPLENNIFYKFKKYLYFDNGQDGYTDLEEFDFFKDEVKNNVAADPLLADIPNFDYHLSPQSPAIDGAYDGSTHAAGTFPEMTQDIDYNNRPIDVPGINNNTYSGGVDYAEYDIGADEYVVGAAFAISGKVTDTDSNPIANVDVLAKSITSSFETTVKTLSDGTYSHSGLEQGKYRITPSKTDTIFWPHYREISVTYGNKSDINFEAITAGASTFIRGAVFDLSGSPIANAFVFITNNENNVKADDVSTTVTTNDQGQFNATLPAGSGYFIKVSKQLYKTKILSNITAPDDLIIYLELDQPSAPKNMKAWGMPSGVKVSWNPPPESNVIGYNLYRDASQYGNFSTRINQSLIKDLSYLDTNVTMNYTYWYKATAVSSSGFESPKSNFVSAVAGSINLFVRDARGIAGGKVRIPISLSNASGLSCSGFSVNFTYDPAFLTPTAFEKTAITNDFTIESNIASSPNGSLTFTGNCADGVTILDGAGRIIDVLFDINPSAANSCALGFGEVVLKNAQGATLTVTKVPATFTVASDYILGDVDGDGDVDADDALLAQKIAVGLETASSIQFAAGDINCDDVIDAADVTLILRIINSLPLNPSGEIPAPAPLYILALGIVSGQAGQSVELPFTITPQSKTSGGDVTIFYDASRLTAEDVIIGSSISSSYILDKNINTPGIINITFSDKSESDSANQAIAAKIKFNISPTAVDDYVPIIFQGGSLSRQFGQKATWDGAKIRLVNGCVCIGLSEWIAFEKLIDYILGKGQLTAIESILADRSRDGIIDIADGVKMIDEGHGPNAK